RFTVFSRTQKYLLCFRIEGHRPRARLRLYWSKVFVIVRGLFVKDAQDTFATRKEGQFGLRIESSVIDTSSDRKTCDHFSGSRIHDDHLRVVTAADEQPFRLRVVS